MKKKVGVLLFSLAVAQGVYYSYPKAEAVIPVIDTANIHQTALTYAQALQTAINTAEQILHQKSELQTMLPKNLKDQLEALNGQLGEVVSVMKSSQGLMKADQSAEQAWKSAFSSVENFGTNNPADRIAQQNNMIHSLDKTYQDAVRISKLNSQVEKDMEALNKTLGEVANAQGNKHVSQAIANVEAQGIKQQIQTNQILGALAATMAAKANYERTIDNATLVDTQKTIQAINEKVVDNPDGGRRGLL